jgi:uncharacterized protein (DUF1684 family)
MFVLSWGNVHGFPTTPEWRIVRRRGRTLIEPDRKKSAASVDTRNGTAVNQATLSWLLLAQNRAL